MWFESKWMQLEDIMLSEVNQAQKDKGHMFSLIRGRKIQKINISTKANMIIYKLICRTCWNFSMELMEGGKGKENDRASNNIVKHNICEDRGNKDILKAVEKWGYDIKG
jgi:hypothetical protein